MAESGVQLVGLEAANDDLMKFADQLGPAVAKDARTFGAELASRIANKVPVLTGRLRDSVAVTDAAEGENVGIGVGLGEGVPYAGWIEFGGSRGRALVAQGRYVYPTAMEAEPQFEATAERAAGDLVHRFPWSSPS